uniref:BLTX358 n=3 Tax=Eukaryota TaxID=2759 RepID=A0A076L2C9_NEPPI|nr:BLTX358 [Nephila pilipes]AII97764.1 BLTX384 [Nephila pilipes]AII97781.1 BLTX405 [Nephila pilipes]AII97899.1 BLTX534 [Nephila pilipes]
MVIPILIGGFGN